MSPALIGYGIAALMVMGLVTGVYLHCKRVDALEGKVLTGEITSEIRKKQDDILVNPTDTDALVLRLYTGAN